MEKVFPTSDRLTCWCPKERDFRPGAYLGTGRPTVPVCVGLSGSRMPQQAAGAAAPATPARSASTIPRHCVPGPENASSKCFQEDEGTQRAEPRPRGHPSGAAEANSNPVPQMSVTPSFQEVREHASHLAGREPWETV